MNLNHGSFLSDLRVSCTSDRLKNVLLLRNERTVNKRWKKDKDKVDCALKSKQNPIGATSMDSCRNCRPN